ncbi:MAG: hypothetical protein DRP82_03430, partial [Planctomycetota bacterium]
MLRLSKVLRDSVFSTVLYASLLSVVSTMLITAGCSSRRHKSHPSSSITITTASLPDATEGVAYSYTL